MEYVDRLSTPSVKALAWWEGTSTVRAPAVVRILPLQALKQHAMSGVDRSAPDVEFKHLPPTWHYAGPWVAYATPCRCSTAYYSVTSACAICQEGVYLTSVSFLHCGATLVGRYLLLVQMVPMEHELLCHLYWVREI